jgi:F0F1-type ATP synthase assembly protein I
MSDTPPNSRNLVNTVLIVMVGQVGCLSLVIILASVMGGLWLDQMFGTKPALTLLLLLAGIPISIVLMLFVARKTVDKIKSQSVAKPSGDNHLV